MYVQEKKPIALSHGREKKSWYSSMGGKSVLSWMYWDSLEVMSEEELRRPSDQANYKVEVNGQLQVQVLVHLHCKKKAKTEILKRAVVRSCDRAKNFWLCAKSWDLHA